MLPPHFSAPRARTNPAGSQEHEITISGSPDQLFQDWVQAAPDDQLLGYFRAVSSGLAERGLRHYHLKLSNGCFNARQQQQAREWRASVYYDQHGQQQQQEQEQQRLVPRCMSCDLDCPLALGVLGEEAGGTGAGGASTAGAAAAAPAAAAAAAAAALKDSAPSSAQHQQVDGQDASRSQPESAQEGHQQAQQSQPQSQQQQQQAQADPQAAALCSRDSLVKETPHCRVWLDAKARPMFVITPKQHIEQLSELSDKQLLDLLRAVSSVLQDMGCGCTACILNQGDNRNHAHLHLKLRVHEREFERASARWPQQLRARLRSLQAFRDTLPPEQRGTHAAFMLRMRQGRAQQAGGGRGGGGDGEGGRQRRGEAGQPAAQQEKKHMQEEQQQEWKQQQDEQQAPS